MKDDESDKTAASLPPAHVPAVDHAAQPVEQVDL